ncbi:MAG: hypothetical protein R3F37_06260 [Candidatus Competibacteraceae bacterium]
MRVQLFDTHAFSIPEAVLQWRPTCHHHRAMELKRFLASTDTFLQVFAVWGHSYELDGFMTADPAKDWAYMETFCRIWHEQDNVTTTAIDLFNYLSALQQLKYVQADNTLINVAARSLWVNWQTIAVEILPGQRLTLQ